MRRLERALRRRVPGWVWDLSFEGSADLDGRYLQLDKPEWRRDLRWICVWQLLLGMGLLWKHERLLRDGMPGRVWYLCVRGRGAAES